MTSVILQYQCALSVCAGSVWMALRPPAGCVHSPSPFPFSLPSFWWLPFFTFHLCHNLYFWPYFWLSRCFSVLQLSACTPHLFFPVIICLHEDSLSVSLAGEWLITLLWLPIGLIKGEAVWYPYRLLLVLKKDHRTAVCHSLLVVENLFFFVVFPMIFFPHS